MTTVLIIVLACVAAACAAVAVLPRREWFIGPAAAIVLAGIAVALAIPVPPNPLWSSVVIGIAFGVVGVLGGSPVVALVLRFAQGGVELGSNGGIIVAADETFQPRPEPREILRGGATIGYLERIAVLGSAAAGQLAAVAVIVAVKGLGRFSELDDSRARERFIIGTLTSLIWAGACATAAVLLG